MKQPSSVGICMVATNSYLEHWKNSALTIDSFAFLDTDRVTIHLFTNQGEEAIYWAKTHLKRVSAVVHEIPGWGWPEATLLRYRFISDASAELKEDFLLYLDSDMEVVSDFSSDFFQQLGSANLGFVQHPGFARSTGIQFVWDLLANPRLIGPHMSKFKSRQKGIGSWENKANSSAYVAPEDRNHYVHGAIWGGQRESVLNMCEVLADRVDEDLSKDYIAIWHDESHLNWFYATHGGALFNNILSGYKRYKHLKKWPAKIITIEKSAGDGRTPTQVGEN